jgi:hypothetical protein
MAFSSEHGQTTKNGAANYVACNRTRATSCSLLTTELFAVNSISTKRRDASSQLGTKRLGVGSPPASSKQRHFHLAVADFRIVVWLRASAVNRQDWRHFFQPHLSQLQSCDLSKRRRADLAIRLRRLCCLSPNHTLRRASPCLLQRRHIS